MTVTVNILENGKGIEVLASGIMYGHEIIQAHESIYDEKHLTCQQYHIIDKSKCTEYNVSADDIAIIAKLDKQAARINPNIIIAIIESESLRFSLTEVWQAFIEESPSRSQSFSQRSKALAWITENLQALPEKPER